MMFTEIADCAEFISS